jgi:Fe-S-cluster-containing hydrogenase component 2
VRAIEEGDESNQIIREKCIGCGLCLSTCPTESIKLVRKDTEAIVAPPKDEMEWFDKRANEIGVDISKYK